MISSSPQYVEKLKGIFRGDSTEMDNTAPMSTSGTATPAEESAAASIDGSGNSISAYMDGIYEDVHVFDDSLMSGPGTHMKFRKCTQISHLS